MIGFLLLEANSHTLLSTGSEIYSIVCLTPKQDMVIEISKGKEILDRILSSVTEAELTLFFINNPQFKDTQASIARRIGKTLESIDSDIKDLADLGIIRVKKAGNKEVLSFDQKRTKQLQNMITDYIIQTGESTDATKRTL